MLHTVNMVPSPRGTVEEMVDGDKREREDEGGGEHGGGGEGAGVHYCWHGGLALGGLT